MCVQSSDIGALFYAILSLISISWIPYIPLLSFISSLLPSFVRSITNCRSYLFFQLKTHAYLYDEPPSTTGSGGTDGTDSDSEPDETAEITPLWAVGLLLASTAVVAVCAEFLVSSIDEMVKSSGVSQAFIGLIVLPIVGNAAEVRNLLPECFV